MARVGGINIPDNKHIDVSLTHIYGIGRKTAQDICNKLDIKFNKKVSELSEKQLKYCAQDVIYLHKIYESLKKILEREKRIELYEQTIKFINTRVDLDYASFKEDIWSH